MVHVGACLRCRMFKVSNRIWQWSERNLLCTVVVNVIVIVPPLVVIAVLHGQARVVFIDF